MPASANDLTYIYGIYGFMHHAETGQGGPLLRISPLRVYLRN